MMTFSRWVSTPENRSARLAVDRVLACVCSERTQREINPLLLHGPTGTGKSHLVTALVNEATRQRRDLLVSVTAAGDFDAAIRLAERGITEEADNLLDAGRSCDLLVIEDLQHLSVHAVESLVQLFDERLARQQQMVFTAVTGPKHLKRLPVRLTSRLSSGVVVGLDPLAPASRLLLLKDRSQRRHLVLANEVLDWLSNHVGSSGRAIEGAITRLESLTKVQKRTPDLAAVAALFRTEAELATPTVERIVERVSGYFQVEPKQVQSRGRHRHALLPRQVGMYLARQLTPLSLEQIGAYFGGRDHSTVLHACRKVELALETDAVLSGAVRQLHADLV